MQTPKMLAAAILVCVPMMGGRAAAQGVRMLVPDRFDAIPGEKVGVKLAWLGTGEAEPEWGDLAWFFVRLAGTQENHDVIPAAGGGDGGVVLAGPLNLPGVAMVGADFRERIETIPSGAFAAFLEGNTAYPPGRATIPQGEVRVRRVESTKTLLRVKDGGGAGDPTAATGKSGQAAEVRPLLDPTSTPVGSDYLVRVHLDGDGLKGAKVMAVNLTSGASQEFISDERGIGLFGVTEPGTWCVHYHHAARLDGDPSADWRLTSATLTFQTPGRGGAR